MNLVQQEKCGDYGAACLAMVLGCTLQEARDLLPKRKDGGSTSTDIVDTLGSRGVPALESLVWPSFSVPAILTVPSLNHAGLLHFVVWDGSQYLDPTHEAKRYPDDSPVMNGVKLEPPWSTVVLLWLISDNQTDK